MATTSATSSSGLDVAGIVSQLMTVEQRPITQLNNKEASYQAKLTAYGTLQGGVSSFQAAVAGLSDASKFQSLRTSSSDNSIVTASSSSTALEGTYALDVTSLAQAQRLVAAGQASQIAAIGNGTLTFDFGTITGTPVNGTYTGASFTSSGVGTKTVTIDATNNSLQGIRDAINKANIGVTASIVNAGGATPYRLALTPGMGASNSLNISVSGDTALSNLLTNNPGTVAAVAGSSTLAAGTKVAAAPAGTTAGTLAAGALIAHTATGGAISIGAVTLGTDAKINGDAIALALNTALATATGGAAANGTAAADINGVVTITAGTDAITLSMGGFAADPATATANQATFSAQTGFDAAQLGTQAVGAQNMTESVMAQNAVFQVNGISISKASNTVTDAIEGVTLNLLKAPTTTSVSVSVARDTSSINTAVATLVKGYNDLRKALQSVSSYDPATKRGGVLLGDTVVRTVQTQVRAALSAPVVTGGSLTTLSQIGISFQKDGTLTLDSSKLNTAISNNFSDIASLFAAVGTSTDSLVAYSSAATGTVPGNYAVNISTLATQGSSSGNVNLNAGSTTIAASTTMSVTLDGTSASVALSAGTYTAAQMAAMVQSAINGTSAFTSASSSVAATIDSSGYMVVTSNRYGSASNVSLTSGNGTAVSVFMGVAPPAPAAGVDVVGTIGGLAATGSGQFLTSAAGNATGLKIQIKGGATGVRGTVNYSHGYATKLNQLTTSMLASDGLIAGKTTGINKSITSIGKQRDALNVRLVSIQKNYTKEFSALDVMLGTMNSTSSYLTQQLANLPKSY